MSYNTRRIQKRHEDADRKYQERRMSEHNFDKKFGVLLDRLDELGIDPDLLAEYLAER